MMEKKRFYQKIWFIVLMLVFVPPVGLVLLWACKKSWHRIIKILLSALFGFWTLIWGVMLFVPVDNQTSGDDESSASVSDTDIAVDEESGTVAHSNVEETINIEEILSETEITSLESLAEESVTETTTEETATQKLNTTESVTTLNVKTTERPTTTKAPTTNETTTKKVTTTAKPTTTKKVTTTAEPTTKKVTTTKRVTTTKKNNSVIVPDKPETQGNLVWVPTNGGSKYHSHSGCSNMKDPIQVSIETAKKNGYTACKRCY